MITLWPPRGVPGPSTPADDGFAAESAEQLAAAYAYPADLRAPHVRVNFVSSADGAVSVDGLSGGLQSPADKQLFGVLRRLADVVLVGAGTARAEDYAGLRRPGPGRADPAPLAVVTGSADLDPGARLFTDTVVAPIVLTTADAPADRRRALTDAGADVTLLDRLTPDALLAELRRRGLLRVLCEGGPGLFGDLLAADAVDELCLTLAPLAAGGSAGRIARGPDGAAGRPLRLAGVIHDDDGTLLLRYRRADPPSR